MNGGTATEGAEAEAGYDASERRTVPWLGVGLATGVVAGTMVGAALGQLTLGIGIGLAVGVPVGTALDLLARGDTVEDEAP